MNSKWILGVALLALSACKNDPPAAPKTETASTATQTAEQAVEQQPAGLGSQYVGLDDDARAELAKSGDPATIRNIMTFEMFRFGNALRDGAVGPYEVGGKRIEKPLMIGLRQIRGIAVRLANPAPECPIECERQALNKLAEPLTAGLFYKADGTIDGQIFKTLVDKLWVEPADDVLGIPAAKVYEVFQPVMRDYALVYKAIGEVGVDATKGEFTAALAEDPTKMTTFYRRYVNMNDVAGKTGLEKSVRLGIAAGFWMRRLDDGTAPVVEETLKRLLLSYDKPLHDATFAAK